MKFSIIIPAHNEELFIGKCLDSIEKAALIYPHDVEIIVVANRCTDKTGNIAQEKGARIIRNDNRNLAMIRNAGAAAATGEILLTIDADSTMSENVLIEIDKALSSNKCIGGGTSVRIERYSLGLLATYSIIWIATAPAGIYAGLFWCYARDFRSINGFDERLRVGEDIDFAKRLRAYGKKQGKRYILLPRAHIVTSCRKFDRLGDWYLIKLLFFSPLKLLKTIKGKDKFADEYFYDFNK